MVRLISITTDHKNTELFSLIKSDEFLIKLAKMGHWKEVIAELEQQKINDVKRVYPVFFSFDTLTNAVTFVKTNNHVFDRNNTVYYFHSAEIPQLQKPVWKHHTDRIIVLR